MQAMNTPDTPASADQGDTPASASDIDAVRQAAQERRQRILIDASVLDAVALFLMSSGKSGASKVVERSAANLRQLVE